MRSTIKWLLILKISLLVGILFMIKGYFYLGDRPLEANEQNSSETQDNVGKEDIKSIIELPKIDYKKASASELENYILTIDKKKSVNKIITDMSNNQQPFVDLFEKEFRELTTLGNNFRIRHHETTKIDIQDKRHYEYFYRRCLSLMSIAIQYLNERTL